MQLFKLSFLFLIGIIVFEALFEILIEFFIKKNGFNKSKLFKKFSSRSFYINKTVAAVTFAFLTTLFNPSSNLHNKIFASNTQFIKKGEYKTNIEKNDNFETIDNESEKSIKAP